MTNTVSRLPALAALLFASVTGLSACGGSSDPMSAGDAGSTGDTIVVGSANFLENELLAQMYAQALESKGFDVETHLNIGSRETLFGAMKDGSIDVLPEYNGALLSYLDEDDTSGTTETVDTALGKLLPQNLTVLDPSPAQDKNTIAVSKATAEKNGLETIADLKPVAASMTFGGAPEDKTRYQGLVGLKQVYGLDFKEFTSLDTAGPLTVNALTKGTVDAAILYSTTPEIEDRGFVALTDPENVFGVQNVIPLVSSSSVPEKAQEVLNSISKDLDTDTLTALNARVQIDQDPADEVAKEWLEEKGLV
ncbi:ABC transporter substrate-binding protein [Kineosporia mesophila]|uniref:ABC transporter substrate-binding protein n=1 Tax=Kineosporia mesophila TaxID=566012 RepID=A0ABP7AAQ3_9ACTN|nr:ABC transporter substrate-binding protein [Kineosporia mesophila]MCD5351404.1 ABC transporter substrate-binding protein [Kineosporia mesophila]